MKRIVELNDKAFKTLNRLSIEMECSKSDVIEILTCDREHELVNSKVALLITGKSAQIFMADDTTSMLIECAKFAFSGLYLFDCLDAEPLDILEGMQKRSGVSFIETDSGLSPVLLCYGMPDIHFQEVAFSNKKEGEPKDLDWLLVN